MVKKNDIVKKISPAGEELTAKVCWVNDEGEVGITYLSPDTYKGAAGIVSVDEVEVIQESPIEDLSQVSTSELIEAINRLREARLPKRMSTRTPRAKKSRKKKTMEEKVQDILKEDENKLDALIERAIREIKAEGGM